jgi:hypothetical protein
LKLGKVVGESTVSLTAFPKYPPRCAYSIGISKGSIKDLVEPVHGWQINALVVGIREKLVNCYTFQMREHIRELGLKSGEPISIFEEFNPYLLLE